MITLFTKQVTVEQIHEEFDTAQERILAECDKVLAELQIPTESKLERKAALLKQMGFEKSEPVKQYNSFLKSKEKVAKQVELTSAQASYIRDLSQRYPFEKFITVDELNRICEKYGLIHAPVKNYIKDIPEKNVLEMANVNKLLDYDLPSIQYIIHDMPKKFLKVINKTDGNIFTEDGVLSIANMVGHRNPQAILDWFKEGNTTWTFSILRLVTGSAHYDDYVFSKMEKIEKSGYFIAAPKSHFDTEGLSKKSKFGFFEATRIEVKDPVVFEYCKNDICRIITKWGTDDDQSYLDESLANDKLN